MKPTLEQQSPTADEVARAIERVEAVCADGGMRGLAIRPDDLRTLIAAAKGADAKDAYWIDRLENHTLHRLVCNYQRGEIGVPGCICVPPWIRAALAAKESP